MRSFADPNTFFNIVVSTTPHTDDGFWPGEPTGEVRCEECGAAHVNVDEIPHEPDCSQRFVHSRWYAETMDADC